METNDLALFHEVTQFVYREARLQDEHAYAEWEALWADDGGYWIPAAGMGGDPEQTMSIVDHNRSRIALRVKQLLTGRHFSQSPRSPLRRIVSNIEIFDSNDPLIRLAANAMVFESHVRGDTIWAPRNEYALAREANGLRMVLKKVMLVNNDKALFSMAFLM